MEISGRLSACSRVPLPLMSQDGTRPDEQAAIDAICGVEDVAEYQRLEPKGSVPTPDWRVTLADGRVADVEVTLAADEAELSFSAQMSKVTVDPDSGLKHHSPKRWPAPRLCCEWEVSVSDHHPADNKNSTGRELVEALTDVLSDVESAGGTPGELLAAASARLVDPWEFMHSPGFLKGAVQFGTRHQVESGPDDWASRLVNWARQLGYWNPEALRSPRTARCVDVVKSPILVGEGAGALVTHVLTGGASFGWWEPLLPTIQSGIDKKSAKKQMQDAPGEKWLAVMLEVLAGWQLADLWEAGTDAPSLSELDKLKFDYFDELWAIAKHPHEKSYVVLRMSSFDRLPHLSTAPWI